MRPQHRLAGAECVPTRSWLNRTLGITPRIQWSLDAFGHSATQASLMSGLLGAEALFFGRAHMDVSAWQPGWAGS